MALLMNAAVIVDVADKASQKLDRIGDKFGLVDRKAKETKAQLERLDRVTFAGLGTAGTGAVAVGGIGVAAKASLESAGKLQDVMKSFEVNAFGKAIRPDAAQTAIQSVIDQAQAVAKTKGVELTFSAKNDAMAYIKKEADNLAQDLGNKTTFGRNDAIAGFDTLQKNGVKMEDILSGAGAATTYLAQITKRTTTEQADGISKMSSAYQLNGKEIENLANLIVKVDGASAASAQSIESGFKYAGGSAKKLGMSVEDLVVSLGSLNSRGVDESTAGTGLDQFLNKLSNQTEEGQKAMKRLGLSTSSFKDAKGNILPMQQIIDKLRNSMKGLDAFRQQEWINTVFGDQGGRAISALLMDGAGSIAEIREQMANSLSLTERAEEANKGYNASLQRMGESWENIKTTIGTPLLDKAANEIEYITKKFGDLADVIEKNPDLTKKFMIGGIAVGGVLALGGTLTVVLATIMKVKTIWGGAFSRKGKGLEQTSTEASKLKRNLDQVTQAAERAKQAVASVNAKKVDVGVNKTKIDQFVKWLKAQQWRKTVYIDYEDGGGFSGGKTKAKNGGGNKKRPKSKPPNGKTTDPTGSRYPVPTESKYPVPTRQPDLPDVVRRGRTLAESNKRPKGTVEVLDPGKSSRRVPEIPNKVIDVASSTTEEAVESAAKKGWLSGLAKAAPAAKGAIKGLGIAGSVIGVSLTASHVVKAAVDGNLENELKQHGATMALSIAGSIAGGAIGAAIGSVVPGAGTVIGGMIGASAGTYLGQHAGEWIDQKGWTARGIEWGKSLSHTIAHSMDEHPIMEKATSWGINLTAAFANGISMNNFVVSKAIAGVAGIVKDFIGVNSPTKEGPLRTNHLWGGNLVKSFADGMLGGLPGLEKAADAAAGTATFSGSASVGRGKEIGGTEGGGVTLVISDGAIQIQVNGAEDPEMVSQQIRKELNTWAVRDLPAVIERIGFRKKINGAVYRPGLAQ